MTVKSVREHKSNPGPMGLRNEIAEFLRYMGLDIACFVAADGVLALLREKGRPYGWCDEHGALEIGCEEYGYTGCRISTSWLLDLGEQ